MTASICIPAGVSLAAERMANAAVEVATKEPFFVGKNFIAKPVYTVLEWMKYFRGSLTPVESQVHGIVKTAKSFFDVAELPKSVIKAGAALTEFADNPSLSTGKTLVSDASSIGGPLTGLVDLTKGVISKLGATPPTWFTNFAGVLPTTLLTGFGIMVYDKGGEIVESGGKIADAKYHEAKTAEEVETRGRMIQNVLTRAVKTLGELIMAVSYIALGIILLSGFFFGAVIAPWALLCSTIALTCTLFNKFYDKVIIDHLPRDPTPQEMGLVENRV